MPEFTSPLAAVATFLALFLMLGLGGFLVAFAVTFVRLWLDDRKRRPRWRPPEEWSEEEIARMRKKIHPRWTPPTVPGQCPICGAMPGERCDAGLHC